MFRRIIIFFILTFSVNTVKAQLDLEHWFPPVYKAYNTYDYSDAFLYLSTPHEIPFKVDIYANNILKESIILSKSFPYIYKIKSTDYILSSPYRLLIPDTAGVHVVGENSFYASIRMDLSKGQTEVITSKGKTALGTLFYSCNVPNGIQDADYIKKLSMITSIIATKNNTHIKISGFSPRYPKQNKLKFGGHYDSNYQAPLIESEKFEVTLNKGESYSLVLWKKYNFKDPLDDVYNNFVGAKIESDKPITVNNGNYLGNFNDQYFEAERGKFMIDQSLPVKKLGTEYYFQKGFTSIAGDQDKFSEKFLIVATKNNTNIYLNDETKPIKTLNEGQYYINKENFNQTEKFINDGVYIRANNPIYVYQLTSGSDQWGPRGEPYAWSNIAMALVPPLDKKLPNTINFIPQVNKITDKSFQDIILQVITEKNKGLKVNGTIISGAGNIVGNDDWEFYRINNPDNNLELSSSGAIIAGLIGGKFSGYGVSTAGFYTGYSNDPYIIQNGNCIQETVFLTISNKDFEGFQWQLNGQDIMGATNDIYIPLVPGIYTCVLSYSGLKYTTKPVTVNNCPNLLSEKDVGSFCNTFVEIPKFSPPNQNVAFSELNILAQPFNGIVKLENNKLYYSSDGIEGQDRYVYKICTSNSSVCETFKINFNIYPKAVAEIKPEIMAKEYITYDLSSVIINANGNYITYYNSFVDAENDKNRIIDFENYTTKLTSIFIRVETQFGCFTIYEFKLKSLPPDQPTLLVLPNILSPNGDNLNDTWDYKIITEYSNLDIKIYDRFGRLVFLHKKNNFFWDGKDLNGRKLSTNTYWVVIQWENPKNKQILNKSMWIYLKNR